jgi:hypothetical protein
MITVAEFLERHTMAIEGATTKLIDVARRYRWYGGRLTKTALTVALDKAGFPVGLGSDHAMVVCGLFLTGGALFKVDGEGNLVRADSLKGRLLPPAVTESDPQAASIPSTDDYPPGSLGVDFRE